MKSRVPAFGPLEMADCFVIYYDWQQTDAQLLPPVAEKPCLLRQNWRLLRGKKEYDCRSGNGKQDPPAENDQKDGQTGRYAPVSAGDTPETAKNNGSS